MLTLTMTEITQLLGHILWPFFRVAAFFMVVPIIGVRLVPVRIRLLLAIVFSVMLIPTLSNVPIRGMEDAVWLTLQQLLIGFVLGFFVQILFQVAVLAGQIIAMQNGLGFATLVDPINGVNVAAIGQLYLMLSNLLFLSMNGHLALFQVLTESFHILPLQPAALNVSALMLLIQQGSWLFAAALLVALPAVVSMLMVNLGFGLLARLAPQLNIFTLGFPFGMVFGLMVIWVSLSGYMPQFEQFTAENLNYIHNGLYAMRVP